MACQNNINKVCNVAVFTGTSKTTSKVIAAFSAASVVWGTGVALLAERPLWKAVGAVAVVGNGLNLADEMVRLQARKKIFTKHVLLDQGGAEIGWSYDPTVARRRLKAYQSRGAFIVPVQEKVDVAEARQQLISRKFQNIESLPDQEGTP